MDMNKVDIRELNENAQLIIEMSDQGATEDLFGDCECIEDINERADQLASMLRAEE